MKKKNELSRFKRHRRIRLQMQGTQAKPRLVVQRSLKNLSAQLVDDTQKRTLFSLSTQDNEIKQKFPYAGNIKAAEFFGGVLANKLKAKGINEIIFDRSGYLYHGRIKVFAENLRKGGLKF